MDDFKHQPACAATLWVENPYWSHLKVGGRAPRTLTALATARADYEHGRRIAEIKAMAPKLELLAAFLQPLAARGIELANREIKKWPSTTFLRIQPAICTRDDRLYAALLELGFREIERKDWGREDLVHMKHGRSLVVVIDVTKAETPVATQSQAVPA